MDSNTTHFSLGVGDIAANANKNLIDNKLLFKEGTDVIGTVPEMNENLSVTAVLRESAALEKMAAGMQAIKDLGNESAFDFTPSIESVTRRAMELVGNAIAAIYRTMRKMITWVGDKTRLTKIGRMQGREVRIYKFYQKRRGTIGAVELKKNELKGFKKLFSSEISDWVFDIAGDREMLDKIGKASETIGNYIPDFNKMVIESNRALSELLNNVEANQEEFVATLNKDGLDSEEMTKARLAAEALTYEAKPIPEAEIPKFLISYANGRIQAHETLISMIQDLQRRIDVGQNDKLAAGLDKLHKVSLNDSERGIQSDTVQALRRRVSALSDIIRVQRRVLHVVDLIHNFDNLVYRAIAATAA